MTDDLVKRLRDWSEYDEGKINDARAQAADRIEALELELKTVLDREAATVARHDAKLDAIEAKLAKALSLVEAAFSEGFGEGYYGGWIGGDHTHAWKKSDAKAELEKK